MMVNMWASCYFGDFNVRAVNYFVTNATDASLSTFDAGKLFYKRFAVRATVSSFGRTVFELTLEKTSLSEFWERHRTDRF
jgi:hypothetical protein